MNAQPKPEPQSKRRVRLKDAGRLLRDAPRPPQQCELPTPDTMGRLRPKRVGQKGGLTTAEVWGAMDADEALEGEDTQPVWSRPLRRHVLWARLPATVADCPEGPCPFVRCRYHLAAEIEFDGSLAIYRKGLYPGSDLADSVADAIERDAYETCALREADKGPHSSDEIGEAMQLDPKRVRQIERDAFRKLRRVSFGSSSVADVLQGMEGPADRVWPDGGGW